jgi:3-hydroxyacyl-CoA dehydrogenase/enoyl-CoA hydratase/3-hydroxybutyryl-CoA epimerase
MSVFRIEWPTSGLAHLVMDAPARTVNVIDEGAIAALEIALAELEASAALEGVVLLSGKPGSFIAGADVNAIAAMTDRAQVLALIRRAHAAFNRLAALRAPTVAAIDGVCLGGGTEIALACDSRGAAEERTQIGLPEVLLGIFPGFGGTTRLPRVVGLRAALDLILTGRALDARRAEKNGLIARAVPGAWLIAAAHRRIEELKARPAGRRRDRYRVRNAGEWMLEGNPLGRQVIFRGAKAAVRARTRGQYPAPPAALRVMELGYGRPIEEALHHEAEWVSDLVVSPVCKNLVRIFLLSERAKKDAVTAGDARPAAVRTLALVGAGVMGGGIAELASRTGIAVRMRDVQPASLTRALQTVRGIIAERSRKKRGGATERDNQLARILPTLELTGLKLADAAIEAVVEDLDVKRRVFGELEVRMRDDALLATNTSSLSVNALAVGL